jgi:intracellular sulfur oxidation DsrE/DsrF family protein
MHKDAVSSSERRSFLTRLNAAALAALALGGAAKGQSKPGATPRWETLRHEKDDWLELPGKHRMVFDTTNPEGLGEALLFTNNFMRVNRSDYGLQNSDLAVVIVVRHRSAPFGLSDAMWAKYNAALAAHASYEDPKSKAVPKINVYNSGDYAELAPNRGTTLAALAKQGVQFAVCANSTRAVAGAIARSVGGSADTVFAELTSNLVTNGRMVPAGIVAVNRAQERGYSLVSA